MIEIMGEPSFVDNNKYKQHHIYHDNKYIFVITTNNQNRVTNLSKKSISIIKNNIKITDFITN